jgi:hypothetical protein
MTAHQRDVVLRTASAYARSANYVPADAELIPVFAATWLLLDKRGDLARIDRDDLLEAGVGPNTWAEVAALVGVDIACD